MACRYVLATLLCLLVARAGLVAAAPVMVPIAPAVSDFDHQDFPGLVVFHVHSDGRLHIHIHLFGTHLLFAPLPPPAMPPVAHRPPPLLGTPLLLATTAGRDLSQLLGWLAVSLALLAPSRWGPGRIGRDSGRAVALLPPDPPPRPVPARLR